MMNAKELLAAMDGATVNILQSPEANALVLRALSLLAAAEANDGTTPETDAEAYDDDNPYGVNLQVVPADFARRLERERNGLASAHAVALEKLKVAKDGWKRDCDDVDKLLRGIGLQPEQLRTEGGSLMVAKALNAALEENARLTRECEFHARQCARVDELRHRAEAELAKLRQHAEAMKALFRNQLDNQAAGTWEWRKETEDVLADYRRDYPEGTK